MNFKQFSLDPRVLAGVKQAGFVEATPIQERAMPLALEGRDVIGLAQTGTGKTAAFLLPILERLSSGPQRQTRALIIAPTRELADQIHESAIQLSVKTQIRSVAIYGGVGKGRQISALRRGTEIVVACPGRLLDLMNQGYGDFTNVEVLVLDEADRMCDMGFLPDIRRIINKLPADRQTLFFSATMPSDIRELAKSILRNPETVQIDAGAPAKTVSHALYPVSQSQKKRLLLGMLSEMPDERVLVFTRTKHRAKNLAFALDKRGYSVAALQGNMAQNKRQKAIAGFRDGRYDILVATDIAARGIDVTQISHVINFDMPDTVDAYTHRIGRTGRAHNSGQAFTFMTDSDTDMVRSIEKVLGSSIERKAHESTADIDSAVIERAMAETGSNGSGRSNGGRQSSSNGNGNGNGNGSSRQSNSKNRNRRRSSSKRRYYKSNGRSSGNGGSSNSNGSRSNGSSNGGSRRRSNQSGQSANSSSR